MRAFVAIDIDDAMLDRLEEMQLGLPGRIVPRENLHLTLAFLGEIGETLLREVHQGLAALQLNAPELRVTELDVFGGKKPKLAFAGVSPLARVPDGKVILRPEIAAVIAAGYDSAMPSMAQDGNAHALRMFARMRAE